MDPIEEYFHEFCYDVIQLLHIIKRIKYLWVHLSQFSFLQFSNVAREG